MIRTFWYLRQNPQHSLSTLDRLSRLCVFSGFSCLVLAYFANGWAGLFLFFNLDVCFLYDFVIVVDFTFWVVSGVEFSDGFDWFPLFLMWNFTSMEESLCFDVSFCGCCVVFHWLWIAIGIRNDRNLWFWWFVLQLCWVNYSDMVQPKRWA